MTGNANVEWLIQEVSCRKKISRLVSGGVTTNYYKCSSKCRHCSYSSSPNWPGDYMTPSMADEMEPHSEKADVIQFISAAVNRFSNLMELWCSSPPEETTWALNIFGNKCFLVQG